MGKESGAGLTDCQFCFAAIYESECERLNWLDAHSTNYWAKGRVTELNDSIYSLRWSRPGEQWRCWMKNQYIGDIGDYGKYGMLRSLAMNGIKIGVNWYLCPNDNRTDGKSHRVSFG